MADSSKTEKATPKKREDERKKGNIFQSSDVISALSILSLFMVLKTVLPFMYHYLSNYLSKYIAYTKTVPVLSSEFAMDVAKDTMIALFLLAGPIMLTSIAVGVIATGAQTRFKVSKENLKMKFSRLSPLRGIKRMFSIRSITELVKAMLKISIVFYILYASFMKIAKYFTQLMYEDIFSAVLFILNSIMDIVIQLSIAFIFIAALDYLYQWWEYERNIKMSKQEIKEEYKQMEGDPQIKGQIKERQRKMSMQRMMQQVPTADVIVRNPTHFAVALKYDIEKNSAPIVVAKGQDYVALKIIEIAEQNHIPMTENVQLARALYKAVDVNREIPEEYYVILAEIMAWVYSMKKEIR
ncbi:flagellar biosynthesis protein FlhB [Caproiciproducens faecalis]|uniref:Flagellar biosynthetic protein FlhB n=1 Tax=Caproiciproducens faecalis TaxID=2820301 RepID=A0ABS7DQH7_9FIRM|nr:flagellar biosynthesis protein FlhB [Caproiciproducens faecalis]MBW7573366.1 flagellar biosynthesis protein FlhB [Caproiciproducens faecalis]